MLWTQFIAFCIMSDSLGDSSSRKYFFMTHFLFCYVFPIREVAGSSQTPAEEHWGCGNASWTIKCRNRSWTFQAGPNSLQWVNLLSFSVPSLPCPTPVCLTQHHGKWSLAPSECLTGPQPGWHRYKSWPLLKCKFINPTGVTYTSWLSLDSFLCFVPVYSSHWLHLFPPLFWQIPILSVYISVS